MGDGWRGLQKIHDLLAVAVGAVAFCLDGGRQSLLPARIGAQRLILVPLAVDVPAGAERAADDAYGDQELDPRWDDHGLGSAASTVADSPGCSVTAGGVGMAACVTVLAVSASLSIVSDCRLLVDDEP